MRRRGEIAWVSTATVAAAAAECVFTKIEGIMSSGSVKNVTDTLFRMRNTLCWTIRMKTLSAFAHSTASLFLLPSQYEDGTTHLKSFLKQLDVYGAASFVAERLMSRRPLTLIARGACPACVKLLISIVAEHQPFSLCF